MILTEDTNHVSSILAIQSVCQENLQRHLHHGDQMNDVVCLVESQDLLSLIQSI